MKHKHHFPKAFLALGMLSALAACSDDIIGNEGGSTDSVNSDYVQFSLAANQEGDTVQTPATRVHFNDNTFTENALFWDQNDAISVYGVALGDSINANPFFRGYNGDQSVAGYTINTGNQANSVITAENGQGLKWFDNRRDHRFFAVYPKVGGGQITKVDLPVRNGSVYRDANGPTVTYQFPEIQYCHVAKVSAERQEDGSYVTTIYAGPNDMSLNYMMGISKLYKRGQGSVQLRMHPILTALNVVINGDRKIPTTIKGLSVKLLNGAQPATFSSSYTATYEAATGSAKISDKQPTITKPVTTNTVQYDALKVFFKDDKGQEMDMVIPANGKVQLTMFVPALSYKYANGSGYSLAFTPIKGSDNLTADPATSYSGTKELKPTSKQKLTLKALKPAVATQPSDIDLPDTDGEMADWIGKLKPASTMLIRNFSLPGAHHAWDSQWSEDGQLLLQDSKQTEDVITMLNNGVRVLDARYTSSGGGIIANPVQFDKAVAGSINQNFKEIKNWLSQHSDEFVVIIMARETSGTGTVQNAWDPPYFLTEDLKGKVDYSSGVASAGDKVNRFAPYSPDMTYADAKGKVILMFRPDGADDDPDNAKYPATHDSYYNYDPTYGYQGIAFFTNTERTVRPGVDVNKRNWKAWDTSSHRRYGNTALSTSTTYTIFDNDRYTSPTQTNYNKLVWLNRRPTNNGVVSGDRTYMSIYDCEVLGAYNDTYKFANNPVSSTVTKGNLPYLNGYLAANHMAMAQKSPNYWFLTVVPGFVGADSRDNSEGIYDDKSLGRDVRPATGSWLDLVNYECQALLEAMSAERRQGKFGMVMLDYIPNKIYTIGTVGGREGYTNYTNLNKHATEILKAYRSTSQIIRNVIWQNFYDKQKGTYAQ